MPSLLEAPLAWPDPLEPDGLNTATMSDFHFLEYNQLFDDPSLLAHPRLGVFQIGWGSDQERVFLLNDQATVPVSIVNFLYPSSAQMKLRRP